MKILKFSCLIFHIFEIVSASTKSLVYELFSSNERNGDVISSFDETSILICVYLCDYTFGCLSVNYHKVNKLCKLTNYYPLDNTMSGTPENGWKIYYRRNFDIDLLQGAEAWQSSTFFDIYYADMKADYALDGKATNIYNCANTDSANSYWAVKFGTPGPVKSVQIKSRTDCCYHRQTNFTITIANSRDDVINDVGTVCGSYFGPAIDQPPFSIIINCTNTVAGKFLKIQHESTKNMVLCEVYVYTP